MDDEFVLTHTPLNSSAEKVIAEGIAIMRAVAEIRIGLARGVLHELAFLLGRMHRRGFGPLTPHIDEVKRNGTLVGLDDMDVHHFFDRYYESGKLSKQFVASERPFTIDCLNTRLMLERRKQV